MAQITFDGPVGLDEISERAALSVVEVAELLGIGRSAAYGACRRGDIPTRCAHPTEVLLLATALTAGAGLFDT